MAVTLEYRLQAGETLRYQQALHMLVREKGAPPQAGSATFEVIHSILEAHHDGTWTVELKSRPLDLEGIAEGNLPAFLLERIVVIRMDRRGTLLDAGEGAQAARLPAFPEQSVEEGEAWTVSDTSTGTPLEVEYVVHMIEEDEGETLVHLVSTAQATGADESVTNVQSTLTFSQTAGCLVQSTTVIEMVWSKEGRSLSLVLENELVERGTAAPSVFLG